ncbi:MAG: radical SAM protein, partial [Acidobacteriota bacterium]
PDNLRRILQPMLEQTKLDRSSFDASIEVDPRRTTREHMAALHELGFRRISLGVQDFDPEVQRIVNRLQPFAETARVTEEARAMGYDSVNFDLIYGLPKQTQESIVMTAKHTLELRPDRIALYSFALVPWIKPTQRSYKDEDIPKSGEKRLLYELARELLLDGGYIEIGMDHFALPHDQLALAAADGTLHRNFMGYTEMRTRVMLVMGVSAISETPDCFHQNEKAFPVYEKRLRQGELPTLRGHRLDEEDRALREQILVFMTRFAVELTAEQQLDAPVFLATMIEDGLVELEGSTLRLTESGLPFLRNACMFFDQRLRRQQPTSRTFSQAM